MAKKEEVKLPYWKTRGAKPKKEVKKEVPNKEVK